MRTVIPWLKRDWYFKLHGWLDEDFSGFKFFTNPDKIGRRSLLTENSNSSGNATWIV
jgi:hypothetical protein